MKDAAYKMFRSALGRMLKALINMWYMTDRDKDNLICWSIGTKYDDHDFALKVNRY